MPIIMFVHSKMQPQVVFPGSYHREHCEYKYICSSFYTDLPFPVPFWWRVQLAGVHHQHRHQMVESSVGCCAAVSLEVLSAGQSLWEVWSVHCCVAPVSPVWTSDRSLLEEPATCCGADRVFWGCPLCLCQHATAWWHCLVHTNAPHCSFQSPLAIHWPLIHWPGQRSMSSGLEWSRPPLGSWKSCCCSSPGMTKLSCVWFQQECPQAYCQISSAPGGSEAEQFPGVDAGVDWLPAGEPSSCGGLLCPLASMQWHCAACLAPPDWSVGTQLEEIPGAGCDWPSGAATSAAPAISGGRQHSWLWSSVNTSSSDSAPRLGGITCSALLCSVSVFSLRMFFISNGNSEILLLARPRTSRLLHRPNSSGRAASKLLLK